MEKVKKKQLKKILTWVGLGVLVALLAAMPLMAQAEVEEDDPVATVHSGTVTTGSVTTALHGGGTLTADDAEDVTLPSGVKITEFLVKNGDNVTEGTPLAAVDKVSVMTAIVSATETMEYLQDEIESSRNDTIANTIRATAGGRIKKVFAQSGEAVQDVMLRDGCLALLSIDGLMAVKIERRMDVATGDSVCVTFADDTQVTGRVESNLDGVIIITIDDEGYEIGESVTITTGDGEEIGSGSLYVHNAWKATAYSGTISTVYAKEENTVSSGASLFALKDTDYTAQMDYLSDLHREYEELLQDLFQMYESGTINAPCAGQISGVDGDSAFLLASETIDGEKGWYVDLLSDEKANGEKGWTVRLLSNTAYADGTCGSATCPLKGEHTVETCPQNVCTYTSTCAANKDKHHSDCIFSCDRADTDAGCNGTKNHHADCIKSCNHSKTEGECKSSKHYPDCIQYCRSSDGTVDCPATGAHKHSCIEDCTHADTASNCKANLHHYADCIRSCITSDSDEKFCPATKHNNGCFFAAMTYKAKVAIVTAVGSSELVVRWDASGQEYEVEKTPGGWKFAANPDFNADLLVAKGENVSVPNPKAYKTGDVIFVITGYKGTEPEWTGISIFMRSSGDLDIDTDKIKDGLNDILGGLGGFGGMGGFGNLDLSAMIGGFRGFGNFSMGGAAAESGVELFDLEGDVLMTVTPRHTVSLTITLDEQDISKVSQGQSAEVKVEALKGEVFEAEVVEVGKRGSNSGGSSKFTAKLRLEMTENMLDGMSASASIPLSTKMEVLVIPVEALVEQGARTVVYTALDEKTGEPCNPVEVTTGVSDGITAEILSGLSSGNTFYYSYYDVLELDTSAEASRYTF